MSAPHRCALITGITGQDGSYLTELLLDAGYEVHGLVRRSSTLERPRLRNLYLDDAIYDKSLFLHYADLLDVTTIRRILQRVRPHEVYHLAGQSHVGLSFDIPESTVEQTATATLRLLEILRDLSPPPRFLHASSREIYGTPDTTPQNEATPCRPNSPYGCAKAFATHMTRIYREAHKLFFCNAICFNHESPRRGENFVSRKISLAAARIAEGIQTHVQLGDIDAIRDWGFAGDYVRAMWLMLQRDTPDDFVISTGVVHSVRDLLDVAFGHVHLDWRKHVVFGERLTRLADASRLCGDSSKARRLLGWEPSVDFTTMIRMMVDSDLALVRRGRDT
jgi:GDPmannose 4,6-dehydratase